MLSVKGRAYTQPPTRPWLPRAFALVLLLATLSTSAGATIFGISTARLSYDIVSVKNQPTDIDNLNLVMSGDDLPVALIAKTAPIPRNGLTGLLYDMGYACQPGIDPNTTLPTPDLYGLDKIALIRRGGPTEDSSCTFRQKLLNAMNDGAAAAIIYNGQGQSTISGATAALYPNDLPLDILSLIVPYETGSMLKAYLRQSTDPSNQEYYDRVRIMVTPDQRMPVIWEFVLIVVVVLLGVSFTVSVILHCRLYALRQRYRAEALARGGDLLPNGVIRMRQIIDKTTLDEFPVRIIGQPILTTPSTSATIVGTSMGSTSTLHLAEPPVKHELPDSNSQLDGPQSGGNIESVEMRTHSRPGSISGKSIRSVRALEAAETLDANTDTVPQEGFTNDMCAICLDEFSDAEEVRTLPCRHEFHCECIDPWLTRKSSTCPLCKYECMKPPIDVAGDATVHEQITNPLPNDRLMEFIMGQEWVASRTHYGHNGTSALDRVGQFFTDTFNRIRGRPIQQQSELSGEQGRLDDSGDVPLQSMTPGGSVVGGRASNQVTVDEPFVVVTIPPPPLDEVRPPNRR